jgi:hypothetical protein
LTNAHDERPAFQTEFQVKALGKMKLRAERYERQTEAATARCRVRMLTEMEVQRGRGANPPGAKEEQEVKADFNLLQLMIAAIRVPQWSHGVDIIICQS